MDFFNLENYIKMCENNNNNNVGVLLKGDQKNKNKKRKYLWKILNQDLYLYKEEQM